jgi:hypothetical protein
MGFKTSYAVRQAGLALYAMGESLTMVMLLSILGDHADIEDGTCWPSVSTLARQCNCTQRYARRLLSEAVAKGYLHVTGRKHRSGTKIYCILEQTFLDLKERLAETCLDDDHGEESP